MVDIVFDYSLDTNAFFNAQRQAVLNAAANDLESRLNDELTAIDEPPPGAGWTTSYTNPTTGELVSEENLTIPAGSIRVYVGARDLVAEEAGEEAHLALASRGLTRDTDIFYETLAGEAWANNVLSRGQAGALLDAPTDIGPWGGSIAFDSKLEPNTRWYDGLSGDLPEEPWTWVDLYSTAIHELGHILGYHESIPGAPTSWSTNIVNGEFKGPTVQALMDDPVFVGEKGHWKEGTRYDGSDASMDPSGLVNHRTRFTELDFAGLDDIGWELRADTKVAEPPHDSANTRPIQLNITNFTQLSTPDLGIDDDGEYYTRVSINFGEFDQSLGKFVDSTGNGDVMVPTTPWTFFANVPANLTEVHVTIQLWDDDDGIITFNGNDDLVDISAPGGPPHPAGSGPKNLELTLNLVDGTISGDPTSVDPDSDDFVSVGNGEGDGDGRAEIHFNFDGTGLIKHQTLAKSGSALTIQGDQFAPLSSDFDDAITLDRTAAGGLKVAINGIVQEYAPGEITSIVTNTGFGTNIVTTLAPFLSLNLPLTINGGGTDSLVLGPGVPAATYTPDGSGLPGYGTLNVGASQIRFAGLEFVEPVAPHVTGVQLNPVTLDENGVATLTGSFTDPGAYSTHTVAVNWGDGTSDPVAGLILGERSFTLTHRYLDDNPTGTASDSYAISVTVTDNNNLTATDTTSVTVNNVAPQLTNVAVTPTIDENGVVTLSGNIVDPGTQDTFTLLVDWGEGTPQSLSYAAGTTTFSLNHQYLDDNPTGTLQDTYTIKLALTDDDSGQATVSASTLVRNLAPVFTALSTSSTSSTLAKEGEPITVQGSFTDVGTLDTHLVTVDWGDGFVQSAPVTEANGTGSFVGQHAYQFGGIYPVQITLQDDDTGAVSSIKAVFVTGVGIHVVGGLTSLQVIGTNQADDVTINQQGNGFVTVHASFLAGGMRTLPLPGLDVIQVVTLGGADRVTVAGNIALPAVIDGGDGNDQLNASNSGSILIGGAGDDSLIGGNGRDILIGGRGSDRLVANGGDDVLIGGYTSYDSGADDDKLANDLKLLKLRAEWNSDRSYADRVANLENGTGPVLGGSGLSLQQGTTVLNDLAADNLIGGAGLEWFFVDPTDQVIGTNDTRRR